jgi:hypothetical protein
MMRIELSVTFTGVIDEIFVINRGHPDDGERPADDDLRRYEWRWDKGGINGEVEHRRSDGALKLAQIVLNDMLGDKSYVH